MEKTKMTNPTPAEIKAWRESAGLTQAQAAALIGYSVQAWEHWEQGRYRMRPLLFDLARKSVQQCRARDAGSSPSSVLA